MTADRAAGVFFILFGGLLLAVIIPWQVETVQYGWLRPRTLPRILALSMMLLGAVLAVWPPGDTAHRGTNWPRAALFAVVLALALALMQRFGFVMVAPAMALAVMWLSGERRILWLALGAGGAPLLIWLAVAVLLERPLP